MASVVLGGTARRIGGNVALLTGAYALGQGGLLLAQSWLLIRGEAAFLGLFGLSFTIASLLALMSDWGGQVVLARRAIAAGDKTNLAETFWSLSCFRTVVAGALVAIFVFGAYQSGNQFAIFYAATASIAIATAAVSPAGLLDGKERSGLAGLTMALPTILSAIILPFASSMPAAPAGAALGAAYSLGMALAVLAQHVLLARLGEPLQWHRPSPATAWSIGREGGLYLLTVAPGQFLYRAQIAAAGAMLGASTMGLVVYAKQIINGAMQFVAFVRRAEFPRLLMALRARPNHPVAAALSVQKLGLLAAAGLSLTLLLTGLSLRGLGQGQIFSAAATVALFAPIVFVQALQAAMSQACVALHRYTLAALVMGSSALAGICAFGLFAAHGVLTLFVVELAVNLTAALAIAAGLSKSAFR